MSWRSPLVTDGSPVPLGGRSGGGGGNAQTAFSVQTFQQLLDLLLGRLRGSSTLSPESSEAAAALELLRALVRTRRPSPPSSLVPHERGPAAPPAQQHPHQALLTTVQQIVRTLLDAPGPVAQRRRVQLERIAGGRFANNPVALRYIDCAQRQRALGGAGTTGRGGPRSSRRVLMALRACWPVTARGVCVLVGRGGRHDSVRDTMVAATHQHAAPRGR